MGDANRAAGATEQDPPDPRARFLTGAVYGLTFSTGVIDAASFVALQVFTAIMTGNVVFVGLGLVGHAHLPPLRAPLAVAAFVLGAVVAGRVQRQLPRADRSPRSSGWLLLAAGATVAGGATAYQYVAPSQPFLGVLTVLLSAAMGVQVAVVRRLAVADLTSVVVTITLANWAVDSRAAGGGRLRARRRLAAVGIMVLGAVTGALLIHVALALALALSAAIMLAVGALLVVAGSAGSGPVARLAG